jgi:hypothetical protein
MGVKTGWQLCLIRIGIGLTHWHVIAEMNLGPLGGLWDLCADATWWWNDMWSTLKKEGGA